MSSLVVGCDDWNDGRPYQSDGWGWGGRAPRGRWGDPWRLGRGAPPPKGAADAGDAGMLADARVADAGDAAVTAAGGLDAAVAPSPLDAAAPDSGVASLGLDDAQVLLAADTLSAGEVAQAQAAQGALTDPDVQAFAAALITEHQAARDTLSALGTSLSLTPAASSVTDQIAADNTAALQTLQVPDAGSLDATFTSEQATALTRDLILLGQLEGTATAEPLRSELVVLQSILQQELTQARQLSGS